MPLSRAVETARSSQSFKRPIQLVEIEPVICDPAFGWTFERYASQQFEERTPELNAILLSLQLVARKMDWEATARRLPTKFARFEEIIGSYQNIEHARLAAQ